MFRDLRHRMHVLRYSWRTIGPGVMLRNSIRWFGDPELHATATDRNFDRHHGTDTTAPLTPDEAAIPAERRRSATMYLPTADRDLAAMLSALAQPDAQQRDTTLLAAGALRAPVELLHADAAAYTPPPGRLVVYLYHPFAADVARGVVEQLAMRTQPTALLYARPTVQPPYPASVFAPFRRIVDGERRTRHFRLAWSIWTNP